jgi:ankyrin repeat protein
MHASLSGANRELFEAIILKDLDGCRRALDAGADPNASGGPHTSAGFAALNRAIERKFTAGALLLLEHGANPHDGSARIVPLHYAAMAGNAEVCRALITRGADTDFQDGDGRTALHWASIEAHIDACNEPMLQGADPRILNQNNRTPLHVAALSGNATATSVVRALVAAGVSPDFTPDSLSDDSYYLTPFQFAVRHGKTQVAQFYLSTFDIDPAQLTRTGLTMFEITESVEKIEILRSAITTRAAAGALLDCDAHQECLAPRRHIPSPI